MSFVQKHPETTQRKQPPRSNGDLVVIAPHRIPRASMHDPDANLTDEEITSLLFLREDPTAADLAMVFAAACEEQMRQRTLRGVELWQQGYVPRVLVTGGGVLSARIPKPSEWRRLPVRRDCRRSVSWSKTNPPNTMENAKLSRELLERAGVLASLKTVLLVSSEWHMARVLWTVKKFFPSTIHFLCCPTLEGCNRGNWTESEECRQMVMDGIRPVKCWGSLRGCGKVAGAVRQAVSA